MANRILLAPNSCDPRIIPFGFMLVGMDAPMPWKLAVQCLDPHPGFPYWPEFWDLESIDPATTTDDITWEKIIPSPGGNLSIQIRMENTGRLFNLFDQEEARNSTYLQATDGIANNVGIWQGIKPVVRPDTLGDVEELDWSFPGSVAVFDDLAWKPMKWDDTDASIYFAGP